MSVNTSEDYLDELLQAIEPIIGTSEPEVYVGYEPEEEMEYEPEATSAEAEYTEIVGEELSDTLSDVVTEDKEASEVTDLLAALTQDGDDDIEDEFGEQEEDVDA